MKISFPNGPEFGVISETGDYDLPVDSVLDHRFYLEEDTNTVKDRYEGVSDYKVKEIDEERAQALEAERTAEKEKRRLVDSIKKDIKDLEELITPGRVRAAGSGDADAVAWLADKDAQLIAKLKELDAAETA